MYAVRSNTGKPFRRSGVTFAPNQWMLLSEITPEQEAEASGPPHALIILSNVDSPADARLGGFVADTTLIEGGFESDEAGGDPAAGQAERLAALESEVAAVHGLLDSVECPAEDGTLLARFGAAVELIEKQQTELELLRGEAQTAREALVGARAEAAGLRETIAAMQRRAEGAATPTVESVPPTVESVPPAESAPTGKGTKKAV